MWCVGAWCINATAQTITVKDKVTLLPLEKAVIYDKTQQIATTTNAKGKADIGAFKNIDTVYIRFMGYKTKILSYSQLKEKGEILLTENLVSLDALVVSASRNEQTKKEVPIKITAIEPKEVMLHNPQTAADMLALSGDIYIQKSQTGGGSPMIRGFATNRVLLTIDGVRMNTAIFRGGNVQNVISLDPFTIAKTEILFGPGSVMYGSDAIGGVMNFFTLSPTLSDTNKAVLNGSFSTRYTSANFEKTNHLHLNLGFNKWAFTTSATFSDYDDLRMGQYGPDEYLRTRYVKTINGVDSVFFNSNPLLQIPTGYSQYNLMQKIRFKPNHRWDVVYGFHYSATSNYSRYDRLIRPKGNTLRSAEWNYGPQIWIMNNLQVNHYADSFFYDHLRLTLAHQFFEESRIDRDLNKSTRRIRKEQVNALSANVDFDKNIGKMHRIFYGVEAVLNQVGSFGEDVNVKKNESIPGPTRYPNGSEWNSYAAYLNYRLNFSDKFYIQTGARYNTVNLNATFDTTFYPFPFTTAGMSNNALTGNLGFVYNPFKTWLFSINASSGFRSPNIDDVGKVFDSSPGSVIVPNPNLSPEYAYNLEVGIAKTISDFVKIDATGFYTLLQDALVRRDFKLNGKDSILYDGQLSKVEAIQNAAFAYVYGIQAGLEVSLPEGIGISSRFNYQLGMEELDNGDMEPLRHAAPWFLTTHITYANNKIKADLYGIYNTYVSNNWLAPEEKAKDYMYAIDVNGKPYSPEWFTLNFKLMYQLTNYFSVSGGVENITDLRYRPYSSGIVAPGRNLIIALKATF
ncbi:MAG: TonB-dependent receptor [Flavobacteriales bacterium]|nr:TonB-dependent receptor [Flavobacteriales bacterium]